MNIVQQKQPYLPGIFMVGSFHLIAGVAVWYAFAHGYTAANLLLVPALILITGLGMTMGYHRLWTHRAFKCNIVLRYVLAACGALGLQGPVFNWAPAHRAHHDFTDKPGDPHSPREYPGFKGVLWAHVFWTFFKYHLPPTYKNPPDLEADPVVRWQRSWHAAIVLSGFLAIFFIAGWEGILFAGFFRAVLGWHIIWSVNSICHVWGMRAKDDEGRVYTANDSRNNIVVAFLALGEGNHANHHKFPAWAYHGWRRYDLDLTKWVIMLCERISLVWDVKKPPKVIRFTEREGLVLPPPQALGNISA